MHQDTHLNRKWTSLSLVAMGFILMLGQTACVSTQGGGAGITPDSGKADPASSPDAYMEVMHDGRIYVLGSEESAAGFKDTHHLPYTQTMIGEGPRGETVVVEVSKSDPGLQKRLWKAFKEKNLYYAEEEHDGRFIVIGSAVTHLKFLNTKHLPYTKTLIGAGKKGETLVFEVDKNNPVLTDRLIRQYQAAHDISLN